MKEVKLPKLNNKRERFLNKEEAQELLTGLKVVSPQVHDYTLLSLYTGCRASEVFSLQWQHLDFQNNLIHIADPKGGEARKAFMTPTIQAMLEGRKPEQVKAHEYVFKSRSGSRITEVSDTFCRVADKLVQCRN